MFRGLLDEFLAVGEDEGLVCAVGEVFYAVDELCEDYLAELVSWCLLCAK